jgi:hypothetical protein
MGTRDHFDRAWRSYRTASISGSRFSHRSIEHALRNEASGHLLLEVKEIEERARLYIEQTTAHYAVLTLRSRERGLLH